MSHSLQIDLRGGISSERAAQLATKLASFSLSEPGRAKEAVALLSDDSQLTLDLSSETSEKDLLAKLSPFIEVEVDKSGSEDKGDSGEQDPQDSGASPIEQETTTAIPTETEQEPVSEPKKKTKPKKDKQ